MSDTQLQIVLSLIDNASAQLQEAQGAFANLGQAGSDAAAQITDALTPAEEAVVAQAQAVFDAWAGTNDNIVESADSAVSEVEDAWAALPTAVQAPMDALAQQMQTEMQQIAVEAQAAGEEWAQGLVPAATKAGEEAGTAAAEGFGGYFKKMIIGYGLEQVGSFLSGGIDSAVAAAAQSQDKISTLTAQIQQQQASIAENEAALQRWSGTTTQVNAAHQKAAANIDAEKAKITELTQQLAPLTQAQQGLPGQIQSIENAILGWVGAHKQLETSLQTFMTTLGPMLTFIGAALIVITLLSVALSVLDGPLLILLGVAAAIAVLTGIWETFHTQITNFLDDLNAKTGIVDLFRVAWQSISDNFNDNLKPALEQLWKALQPLTPYLEAMAEVVGATLLGAIVLLTDALTIAINVFTGILTIATKVATFFTDVLVVAINAVKTAIEAVITAVSKVGSVGGAIGGAISSTLAHIPGFATGGIVTGPTLAMVGEAGPEAIIPLSAFAGGSSLAGAGGIGGGAGIQVFIQGGTYLDQNGATTIANALARQIQMQIKLRNFA
jgi:hypothetical protein